MSAVTFSDLVGAESTKLRTLPASWLAPAVAFVANTVLGVLAATDVVRLADRDGEVPIAQLGTVMLAPVYVFIALAVFAAGSEYRGGQLRISLLAVPDRARLYTAKLAVTVAISLLASIIAVLPGYVIQHAADLETGAAVDLTALLAAYLLLGLIGFGFAVIARTVVTPLAALFIAAMLLAPTLRGAFPAVVRYLPHDATLSLLDLSSDPDALGRVAGLLVLAAWAALFVGAAGVLFTRRDS